MAAYFDVRFCADPETYLPSAKVSFEGEQPFSHLGAIGK